MQLSFSDLADNVGITKTPVLARLRVEKSGVLRGYRGDRPASLGLELHAFVQVTLDSRRHSSSEAGGGAASLDSLNVTRRPGQGDYLLHVLVAGITALDGFLRNEISRMPGVQRLHTTVRGRESDQRADRRSSTAQASEARLAPQGLRQNSPPMIARSPAAMVARGA